MEGHVDGNAIAGVLSDFFAFDVTTARARCLGCGDTGEIARTMVWGGDQGLVVRCPECAHVLMVVVTQPSGMRLQMRGMAWMEVSSEEPRRP